MTTLDAQQMNEFREAFELYDQDGRGKVPLTSIGLILNSLGQCPSHSLLEDLRDKKLMEGETELEFAEFKHLINNQNTIMMTKAEVASARAKELEKVFVLWDPTGTGFVKQTGGPNCPVVAFTKAIANDMDPQEVEGILEMSRTEDGSINYIELCGLLTTHQ